jgi:hypothetical protein
MPTETDIDKPLSKAALHMKATASNLSEQFFNWSLFAISAIVTYVGGLALLIK